MRSLTLRNVRLVGLPLRYNAHDRRTPQQFQELDINHTLKDVHIEACQIGDEGLALLSCFRGIETLRVVCVRVEPDTPERVTHFFSRLHALRNWKCKHMKDGMGRACPPCSSFVAKSDIEPSWLNVSTAFSH